MTIKNKIKNSLYEFIVNRGFYVTRSTAHEQLKKFFEQIKPYTTNKKLIRLGGDSDGGYLVPDDLEGSNICFSPGVSEVANFELDLANRDIQCFLADYSVDAPPFSNKLFDFEKKYLGIKNDEIFMTLEKWIEIKAKDQTDLILQMDIEGAEYSVILNTSVETFKKFRIIVIEFHNLNALFDRNGFDLINLSFYKLLQDFYIVHIHPNNCSPVVSAKGYSIPPVMEFTFLRKDRIFSKQPSKNFPHALDIGNIPNVADLPLPSCWQGS